MGAWCTSPTNNVKDAPENKNKDKKSKKSKKNKKGKNLETKQQQEDKPDPKEFLTNPFKRPAALSNPQETDHSQNSEYSIHEL